MSAYHQPETLRQALELLRHQPNLKIVAGATDVYPAQTTRAGWGDMHKPDALDISLIKFGAPVASTSAGWSLTPLTTWTDLMAAELPSAFDALKAAARQVGGAQVQNRGTVIGNICNASPAADGVPPLLTLDAVVEISSHAGVRKMRLGDFITGNRRTALQQPEMVTGLHIPKQAGRSVFVKLGARAYLVISIVMVAAVIDTDAAGFVRTAKIAVGACSSVAQRLTELEADMIGKQLTPELVRPAHLAGLSPIDDIRASADYRRHAALTLVRDAIAELAGVDGAHG